MAKSIATFGIVLASDTVEQHDLSSKTTLLDYDIVLLRFTVDGFVDHNCKEYQGKPCLSDTTSFRLREACAHWRREVRQAIEAGKTVVVFLSKKEEIFVATGNEEYSGSGRNRRTTRIVEPMSNYSMLPLDLTITNAAGSSVRLTDAGARWLAPYWDEFGFSTGYKVQIASEAANRLSVWLTTKGANLPVGGVIAAEQSGGALMLLPDLDFEQPEFFQEMGEETDWSDAACQFAARLVSSIVAIDKQWRAEAETTPEPAWATLPMYALHAEQNLQSELLRAERVAEETQAKVNSLKNELASAGHLRALLFEKGKSLESAIIQALKLMGFKAKPYKEGASEFDVVFECDGGRLLGEAEGKDTKAVNVDKLRQLAMNIHEDLSREEVAFPAKGVLFGNGFRLQPPDERDIQFTDKCVSAALSQSIALVATSSLFSAAQYLSKHPDEGYMTHCRDALLAGTGLVKLPDPPTPVGDVVKQVSKAAATRAPGLSIPGSPPCPCPAA